VPDRDGVVVHQDVLDDEADDLLPIGDFQRLGRLAQPLKERAGRANLDRSISGFSA
jgi:hypothetical protein